MKIGIDASNIRSGGGLIHLQKLLDAADPIQYGIENVVVWGSIETLSKISNKPWILKHVQNILSKSSYKRLYWQLFKFPLLAKDACDLLYIPGGNNIWRNKPYIAMSQNLLPFENLEKARYGLSWTRFRLLILRFGQAVTFRNAEGVIFLTKTAKNVVMGKIGNLKRIAVIPHGISSGFRKEPRLQMPISSYSDMSPYRWLYVSIIDVYKHQWKVAEAVRILRREGFPVALDFVGPAYPPAKSLLLKTINRLQLERYISCSGEVPHSDLASRYANANAFIFASSCENMPIILLEAMAAGLPIACSNRGPMPEMLGDAGVYFDPEDPEQIAAAMRVLMTDPSLRTNIAGMAYERATKFTWERCAHETFSFLSAVAAGLQQPSTGHHQ